MRETIALANEYTIHNLNAASVASLDLLIQSEAEADEFVTDYLMYAQSEILAVMQYRQQRVIENRKAMTEQVFLVNYHQNPKDALEQLFFLEISDSEFVFWDKKVKSHAITPNELYQAQGEDPSIRFARFLR